MKDCTIISFLPCFTGGWTSPGDHVTSGDSGSDAALHPQHPEEVDGAPQLLPAAEGAHHGNGALVGLGCLPHGQQFSDNHLLQPCTSLLWAAQFTS